MFISNKREKQEICLIFPLLILFAMIIYNFIGSPFIDSSPFSLLFMRDPTTFNNSEQLVYMEVMSIRNPKEGYFVDMLADLYLEDKRYLEASQNARKAIVLQGENSYRLLRYALACIGYDKGFINSQTEAILRRSTMLDPLNIYAQLLLVQGLIQGGREHEAIQQLKQFLYVAPITSKWTKHLKEILHKLKQKNNYRK